MRILVVSEYYSPHYQGGYEIGCYDAVEALRARGHTVRVLTSVFGVDRPQQGEHVLRVLRHNPHGPDRGLLRFLAAAIWRELVNQRAMRRVLAEFQPDVLSVWRAADVSVTMLIQAQRRGHSMCFYVFDQWLACWEQDTWYSMWTHRHQSRNKALNLAQRAVEPLFRWLGTVAPGPLQLEHTQVASTYLRQLNCEREPPIEGAELVPWGLDEGLFRYNPLPGPPRRLLFVGRLIEAKGCHVAIDAVRRLVCDAGREDLSLTIVGTGPDEYVATLRARVEESGIERHVRFLGFRPRQQLPEVYHAHHVLLFPTIWEEPFGITILEAMASGLAVVASGTGGSADILEPEVNALVAAPGDECAWAAAIRSVVDRAELYEQLREAGRRTVVERYRFERTMDAIEDGLRRAAASRGRHSRAGAGT